MPRFAARWMALVFWLAGSPAAIAQETAVPIVNPGFEGAYVALPAGGTVTGRTAPGWDHNSGYGDTTTVYARDTANPHSGAACQSITVWQVRDGNLQLLQGIALKAGTIITVGAWLRGTAGTRPHVSIQASGPGYDTIATASTTTDTMWRYVSAQGYVTANDPNAALVISLDSPGKFCIDDVTVSTRPGVPSPVRSAGPVPQSFFGIHVANFQFSSLRNPRFNSPRTTVGVAPDTITGQIAHDWDDNSDWADVTVAYRPDPTPVPGGSGAQAVEVGAVRTGRQQMRQSLVVLPNRTYTFTAQVRGSMAQPVEMLLRNADEPYNAYASRILDDLGSDWKTYQVTGKVGPSGRIDLMFAADTPGTYAVADVRLTTEDGRPAPSGVVFPPAGFGTLRLWDSGTTWAILEPQKGKWQFAPLDRWMARVKPGQEVILTLGQSPVWASSDPSRRTFYGAGASAPPKNLADWTDYVAAVARRYKGRIRYYEVWNEPNDDTFFSGTVDDLVKLTRAARQTLRAVDPDARLISAPAYSADYLNQYLAAGIVDDVDVIGFHVYATPPEEAGRQLANVRLVLDARRVTKPLWDTEGGSGDKDTPTAEAATYMARKYLVDLAFGAGNFGWYGWGTATPYAVGTVPEGDPAGQTAAARAFFTVRGWLLGASLASAKIDARGTWRIGLDMPGGRKGMILWNPKRTQAYAVPAAFRNGRVTDLSGTSTPVPGATLQLDFSPILLTDR